VVLFIPVDVFHMEIVVRRCIGLDRTVLESVGPAESSKFLFKNPNINDACGCGESFNVGS
jgi:Fe-S cluster assembly iron-binding protein IscA